MIKKLLLGLPPAVVVGSVYLIFNLMTTKKNWSTNPNSKINDIEKRTANRGMFVSIVSAIILSVVGGVMASLKIPQSMIVTNYGFILGPVIGYMLDIGIGTDVGFEKFKKSKKRWLKHIFSSLVDRKFLRYCVTVLLDLFISDPIQDILKLQMEPITKDLKTGGSYSKTIASNLPSILQALVGFITFNAYTNQTRFNWAYPSDRLPEKDKMSTFLVGLSTAIAGCLYIVHNKKSSDRGTKIGYVIGAITLLYIMNSMGLDKDEKSKKDLSEEEIADEVLSETEAKKSSKKKKGGKLDKHGHLIGMIVFLLFVGYGLVWPLLNAGKEKED